MGGGHALRARDSSDWLPPGLLSEPVRCMSFGESRDLISPVAALDYLVLTVWSSLDTAQPDLYLATGFGRILRKPCSWALRFAAIYYYHACM